MYEAVFRVAGGGAYAEATDDTDTTIELWCNDHRDLLHVSGRGADAVLDEVRDTVGVSEHLRQGEELVLVTSECLTAYLEHNVEAYLADQGCLLVPPLTYTEGAKLARVLALDAESLSNVYAAMAEDYAVTVESKREIQSVTPDAPLLTVDAVLPALSARQREVFLTAYEMGYYELPRETSTEAIADAVGVSRRTAEEHLRRAEKKLTDALVEFL
ncbi:helix-turn-helix domain-containing protein [Haloarcula sp. JP-L23]|uniref:helix-turn-helix domain-containing protein n=1 Tax=Haloarcula sp. JP-L23 TaxID=2716717 RepID=UPI00140ECBA4|nr:transcriptional regulator [Haloarcula sp. JP-L23]